MYNHYLWGYLYCKHAIWVLWYLEISSDIVFLIMIANHDIPLWAEIPVCALLIIMLLSKGDNFVVKPQYL